MTHVVAHTELDHVILEEHVKHSAGRLALQHTDGRVRSGPVLVSSRWGCPECQYNFSMNKQNILILVWAQRYQVRVMRGVPSRMASLRCQPVKHWMVMSGTQYP